ncbi:MAG TPA: hypothetical protein VN023_09260 [Methylovorus sp.]|nr:hypothetical protein [Methylovorus sp.]
MTPQEKIAFADDFLALYLSMGFGSLPKREIDLFVFHSLTKAAEHRGKSNYELANTFGISESRIKSLKLNSALRHQDINPHAILARVVERLIASQQFAELSEGKIDISLEDPLERRELENFLKTRGHHAEYTLNREVLRISPARLLELIVEHAERAGSEFDEIIRSQIKDQAISSRILAGAPSLKQKLDRLRAENLNLATLKSLITKAFTLF